MKIKGKAVRYIANVYTEWKHGTAVCTQQLYLFTNIVVIPKELQNAHKIQKHLHYMYCSTPYHLIYPSCSSILMIYT